MSVQTAEQDHDTTKSAVRRPPNWHRRRIEDVLTLARLRLDRLEAGAARDAVEAGAVIVDIRPEVNRVTEGSLPGAIVIERNVLEWRLDPECDARIDIADYDLHVIVMCNEGYTSSLAAADLQDLGIHRATDLVGGFRAWKAAGLPTAD